MTINETWGKDQEGKDQDGKDQDGKETDGKKDGDGDSTQVESTPAKARKQWCRCRPTEALKVHVQEKEENNENIQPRKQNIDSMKAKSNKMR